MRSKAWHEAAARDGEGFAKALNRLHVMPPFPAMDALDEDPVAPPLRPPLHNSSAPRDQEPLADELEKLRQWQEARIARKLRGEYESAVHHLSELVCLFGRPL